MLFPAGLIGDLARAENPSLRYEFEAKLGLTGLYPSIRVTEEGYFSLSGGQSDSSR